MSVVTLSGELAICFERIGEMHVVEIKEVLFTFFKVSSMCCMALMIALVQLRCIARGCLAGVLRGLSGYQFSVV